MQHHSIQVVSMVETHARKGNDWLRVNEDEDSAVVVKRALIAYI